ncbi:MAG: bacillithiol system redox-active protein YtxJ [Leadbetterella sp.]
MDWNKLNDIQQLQTLKNSKEPVLIFKHSTRCSISSTALDRFERSINKGVNTKGTALYLLDLLNHRDISNAISSELGVLHESPQAILIQNGEVKYHASHYDIDAEEALGKV